MIKKDLIFHRYEMTLKATSETASDVFPDAIWT